MNNILRGVFCLFILTPNAQSAETQKNRTLRISPVKVPKVTDKSNKKKQRKKFRFGFRKFILESATLVNEQDHKRPQVHHAGFTLGLDYNATRQLLFKLEADADYFGQSGEDSFVTVGVDYGENYLKYATPKMSTTLGAQHVNWSRIDVNSASDIWRPRDLRQFVLPDNADTLALPLLRTEFFFNKVKLDLIYAPWFRPARLPIEKSIWSNVDVENGSIGLQEFDSQLFQLLVRDGSVDHERIKTPDHNGGIRIEHTVGKLDLGFTLAQYRNDYPYYSVNQDVLSAIAGGIGIQTAIAQSDEPTFLGQYNKRQMAGVDCALEAGGAVWRSEFAYKNNHPVTLPINLKTSSADAMHFGLGAEFYPLNDELTINVAYSGYSLQTDDEILDPMHFYGIAGSIRDEMDHGKLHPEIRLGYGLHRGSLYISPSLGYNIFPSHLTGLSANLFSGEQGSPGAMHQGNSLINFFWRADL